MRETFRILHNPQQYTGTFYHGTPVEQTNLLQNAMCLMKVLDSHPTLAQCARPVLWHTDLHMGNIYVSPDEPSRIVSIIDWQSTSVSPAFLQVWWPVFLRPPKNYTKGLVKLKLPENFDQMDSDDKELAKYEMKQATMAKAYEVSTYLEDRAAHNAMNMPRVFRELFTRCGETSEVGVIPLRACLIEIFQTDHSWVSPGNARIRLLQKRSRSTIPSSVSMRIGIAFKGWLGSVWIRMQRGGYHPKWISRESADRTKNYEECSLNEWRKKSQPKKRGRCGHSLEKVFLTFDIDERSELHSD